MSYQGTFDGWHGDENLCFDDLELLDKDLSDDEYESERYEQYLAENKLKLMIGEN